MMLQMLQINSPLPKSEIVDGLVSPGREVAAFKYRVA